MLIDKIKAIKPVDDKFELDSKVKERIAFIKASIISCIIGSRKNGQHSYIRQMLIENPADRYIFTKIVEWLKEEGFTIGVSDYNGPKEYICISGWA